MSVQAFNIFEKSQILARGGRSKNKRRPRGVGGVVSVGRRRRGGGGVAALRRRRDVGPGPEASSPERSARGGQGGQPEPAADRTRGLSPRPEDRRRRALPRTAAEAGQKPPAEGSRPPARDDPQKCPPPPPLPSPWPRSYATPRRPSEGKPRAKEGRRGRTPSGGPTEGPEEKKLCACNPPRGEHARPPPTHE
jgi:hypothetical protein